VIVQVDAGSSVSAAKARVRAAGGKVTADLSLVNGFAATLPASAADSLPSRSSWSRSFWSRSSWSTSWTK